MGSKGVLNDIEGGVSLTVIFGYYKQFEKSSFMNEKKELSTLETTTGTVEKAEVVLYQPDDSLRLEVRLENESVWLNRQQISVLFDRDIKTIGKHIKNALGEELANLSTVANFATVQIEGDREVKREIEYYDLNVILSVGYRVKSQRGIQFRIWSNRVLKEYLLRGHTIGRRIENIEHRLTENEKKIEFFVRTSLPPVQGLFFEGQIFDAYVFVSDLIRSAKRLIVLIDNYVGETTFLLLSKRVPGVSASIHTKKVSPRLQLDLEKHNSQYEPMNIYETDKIHDRFLIVDNVVYHVGSSFKDLGKKLFAFSKLEMSDIDILELL